MAKSEVFLDTSFVIASTSARDQYHLRAQTLQSELRADKTQFITTAGVLLEIGNSLAKLRTRPSAGQAIASLVHDPTVKVVHLDEGLFARALEL